MTTIDTGHAFDSLRLDALRDEDGLRRAYDLPSAAAARKQMTELTIADIEQAEAESLKYRYE